MTVSRQPHLFSMLPALMPALWSAFPLPAAVAQNEQPAAAPASAPPESRTIELTPETQSERPLTLQLRGGGTYTFSSDIDNTPGDVAIGRANVGFGVGIPIAERSKLTLDVDEEVAWYLFENASGLVPGTTDPFEFVVRTNFRPMFSSQIDEHWSWYVSGILNFEGEAGADIGDSATYGGYGGAQYRFSDNFSLSLGLGARTRLEESTLVLPVVLMEWKVTDRVSVFVDGLGGRVTAQLTKELGVTVSGKWDLREYRLDDSGPLPNGVARDERVPIGLMLDWKPTDNIQLSFGGGVVVWQQFRFDDSNGNRISETNTNPAPFVGLSGTINF